MGRKDDLRAQIRANNLRIEQIRQDIHAMENAIKQVSRYAENFQEQKTAVEDYDMTVGDTWKEDLCTEAKTYQVVVADGIEAAVSACGTTVSEINTCIDNANDEIARLEQNSRDCEDEIRRIEEEEARAAAERAKHPERYRC